MEQEHLLILELLDEGKITVPEALHLIEAIDEASEPDDYTTPNEQTITVQLSLNESFPE